VVTVYFTDTAKADIRSFVADPAKRRVLVSALDQGLSLFPARHKRCPSDSGFGPDARFYGHDGFTVIYDLVEEADHDDSEVWVRHVWPAASLKAAGLIS
jgi:hypothetical protein